MVVLPVPSGLLRYQPQERRMRSNARVDWRAMRCPLISNDWTKATMLLGSSGQIAPMGPQFLVRDCEMVPTFEASAAENARAMLLAS